MATYTDAPPSVLDLMESLLEDKFALTLHAVDVRVGVLMAYPNKAGLPALKIKGYPVLAKVKVIGLEDRVAGQPDARIVIDAGRWSELSERQREALLAHELYHLDLQYDDEGAAKTDDHGRPCLKNRPHDVEAGMFREVHDWYGEDSCEALQHQTVERLFAQTTLPFGESDESGRKPRGRKGVAV